MQFFYKLIQGFTQTFPVVLFKTPDWAIHTIENPKLQIAFVYVNVPSIVVRTRKLENVSTNFSSHRSSANPDHTNPTVSGYGSIAPLWKIFSGRQNASVLEFFTAATD